MVSLNKVIASILELQDSKKITGIKDIEDDGEEGEIDKKIILKKEVDPIAIMHTIYTKTNMQATKPVVFKVIDEFQDLDYNVKAFLLDWIDMRIETKRRVLNNKLIKAKERQHILHILLFLFISSNAYFNQLKINNNDSFPLNHHIFHLILNIFLILLNKTP